MSWFEDEEEAKEIFAVEKEVTSVLKHEDQINMQRECDNKQSDPKSPTPISNSRIWQKVPNVSDQMEMNEKLLKFVAESKFTLTQINGQRRLGPPQEWNGPKPCLGCEIFVGSIPRNFYEPDIVPIFSKVGTIYELRLMMDFCGTNRGYCFIMYTKPEEAARAVKELDQYEIYPGKRIGVVASVNNCRLLISQVPRNIESETLIKQIYSITEDIENIAIYRSENSVVKFILISFKTHRAAAMGRRRLVSETLMIAFQSCDVNVEWADPNFNPSDVFEENGVCDENGKVKIIKKFLSSADSKKTTAKRQLKATEKHRSAKFANPPEPILRTMEQTRKHHLTKSNLNNFAKNGFKVKENRMYDMNGNLKNIPILAQNLKHCSRYQQSSVVLPPISFYLNKRKAPKNLQFTNPHRNPLETYKIFRGEIFFDAVPPKASSNFYDKYEFCKNYPSKTPRETSLNSVNFPQKYWSAANYLPRENIAKIQVNRDEANPSNQNPIYDRQNSVQNQIEYSSYPWTARNIDNHVTYSNYYPSYSLGEDAISSNPKNCDEFSSQIINPSTIESLREPVFQNPNSLESLQSAPFNNYFANQSSFNSYCFKYSLDPFYQADAQQIQELTNGISNIYLNNSEGNNVACDQQKFIIDGISNRGYNGFSRDSTLNPLGFVGNRQENFVSYLNSEAKCFRRPIRNGTTANIKNY